MKESKKIFLIPYEFKETLTHNTEIPRGVDMVGATNLWNKDVMGENVVIAVIDTGCQIDHPDLVANIVGGRNFTPDYDGDVDNYDDNLLHGTHVAGTIAASLNNSGVVGVAPKAKLLILKAISISGHGSYDYLIEAIIYAVQWRGESGERVRIITMSLGGYKDDKNLHEAIKLACKENILVICASGNLGDNDLETDEIMYPGYYEEVVEVGAIDFDNMLAPFSNTNGQIDLYAPGVGIISTSPQNTYAEMSGTSMAVPHVAGAAALIISKFEKMTSRFMEEHEIFKELCKNTQLHNNFKILSLK
ncbi:S8 family peptidase [Paenibacillus sp. SI8]|uniref:S8 family peptidase n=1 Tax=unclassified Paenibacillus TaxID=185978 RepID=UPI003466B158